MMNVGRFFCKTIILVLIGTSLQALPVSLGSITIGLESFDGYQEGMANISTNEQGEEIELLIAYKGFGLDEVSWLFSDANLGILQDSASKSSWWRSGLLNIDVKQTVVKDVSSIKSDVTYRFRGVDYPFDDTENTLQFIRQGRDYALLLTEISPGAQTRSHGEKTLPVFTLHFSRENLPLFRDLLSESHIKQVIELYTEQKAAIESIFESSPKP